MNFQEWPGGGERMIKNGWTEELERLRAVNGELLEACKAVQTAHPLREGQSKRGGALGLVDAAIRKAGTP